MKPDDSPAQPERRDFLTKAASVGIGAVVGVVYHLPKMGMALIQLPVLLTTSLVFRRPEGEIPFGTILILNSGLGADGAGLVDG